MCRGQHRYWAWVIPVGSRSTEGDLATMVVALDVKVEQHLLELPGDGAGIGVTDCQQVGGVIICLQ